MSNFNINAPWIQKREAILCGWDPEYVQGKFTNSNVDLSIDWYGFSDEQIVKYAQMLKECGYTGIQIADDCSHWAIYDDYNPCHERIKKLANILHENDMTVSLVVWAANFENYGWANNIAYQRDLNYFHTYDDPSMVNLFNYYYDIYADLSAYTDMLILRFVTPGSLTDAYSIINFSKLIEGKFKLTNPQVKMGISLDGFGDSLASELIESELENYMFLEPNKMPATVRRDLRTQIKDHQLEAGIWSWQLSDIEVDQNAVLIMPLDNTKKEITKIKKEADDIVSLNYWSEMDSYHVLNLPSLYVTCQLLIDPEKEVSTILDEFAFKIGGNQYKDVIKNTVLYIEEFRTYNTAALEALMLSNILVNRDCVRAIYEGEQLLVELQKIVDDKSFVSNFTLPVSLQKIVSLVMSHIKQIKEYAQFVIDAKSVEYNYKKLQLQEGGIESAVAALWNPINDYDTIIGTKGQREARSQAFIIEDLCKRFDISFPENSEYEQILKNRYYEYFQNEAQRIGSADIPYIVYENSQWMPEELRERLITSLIENGLIVIDADKTIIHINDYTIGG